MTSMYDGPEVPPAAGRPAATDHACSLADPHDVGAPGCGPGLFRPAAPEPRWTPGTLIPEYRPE